MSHSHPPQGGLSPVCRQDSCPACGSWNPPSHMRDCHAFIQTVGWEMDLSDWFWWRWRLCLLCQEEATQTNNFSEWVNYKHKEEMNLFYCLSPSCKKEKSNHCFLQQEEVVLDSKTCFCHKHNRTLNHFFGLSWFGHIWYLKIYCFSICRSFMEFPYKCCIWRNFQKQDAILNLF